MPDSPSTILQGLADAVVQMDEDAAVRLAHEALEAGIDPHEAIHKGLARGMDVVSVKYDEEEYFVPEILLCSDAMYAALDVLQPHLKEDAAGPSAKVVIGVIEGDTHDIGKNIVRVMMEAAGFEVHDLGRDVPVDRFVEEAGKVDADVVAISTLMSTTRHGMKRVVDALVAAGIRDRVKVLLGGPPVSWAFCTEIGADAYGSSPREGIEAVRRWVGEAK
jgi:dimethylamine corrinoid protein